MGNQTEQPDSVEDNSPDNITPEKHPEQHNAHQRLVGTAKSLKKWKQRLRAAQDTLRIRWSEVLNTAAKYGGSRHTKSYPKRKLLPEFDEEALDPPQSKNKIAIRSDRRPHGQHRAANNAAHKPVRGPREGSHQKDDANRSIYGPSKRAPACNATQQKSEHHSTPK